MRLPALLVVLLTLAGCDSSLWPGGYGFQHERKYTLTYEVTATGPMETKIFYKVGYAVRGTTAVLPWDYSHYPVSEGDSVLLKAVNTTGQSWLTVRILIDDQEFGKDGCYWLGRVATVGGRL